MNYKAIISYQGTNYRGWQSQTNGLGIEDILKKTLYDIFKLECTIIGASRTDSGVHAEAQVVLLKIPKNLAHDLLFLKKIINDHLPYDICINDLSVVDDYFHPRKNVDYKIYSYFLTFQKPNTLYSSYVYFHKTPVNLSLFEEYLEKFKGTHHFGSFVTGEYPEELYIKTIQECKIIKDSNLKLFKDEQIIQIDIQGNGFLRYMIRRMIGACITLASSNKEGYTIKFLLDNPRADRPLFKMPPQGLILRTIKYKE